MARPAVADIGSVLKNLFKGAEAPVSTKQVMGGQGGEMGGGIRMCVWRTVEK